MAAFFGSVLISTGDASRMTGYSPEYLNRLVEAGVVSGRKFGHTWFVSRYALEQHFAAKSSETSYAFVDAHADAVSDHMRAVQPVWLSGIAQTALHEQLFALSVAAIVLLGGAAAARSLSLPNAINQSVAGIQAVGHEIRVALLSSVPARIGELSSQRVVPSYAVYAAASAAATATMQRDLPGAREYGSAAVFNSSLRTAANSAAQYYETRGAGILTALVSATPALVASFDSPKHAWTTLTAAYVGMGDGLYGAAYGISETYLSLVRWAGAQTFALAVQTRDTVTRMPQVAASSLSLVWKGVQGLTTASINADVRVAYGIANDAPSLARSIVLAVGTVGQKTAQVTTALPDAARFDFLRFAAWSSSAGRAVAARGFAVEYGAAHVFLGSVQGVLSSYESGVQHSRSAIALVGTTVSSAARQSVREVQVALQQAARFSRVSIDRGATATAAVLGAFSL